MPQTDVLAGRCSLNSKTMNELRNKRLSVSISEAEYQELQKFSEQHDLSVSWLVRRAILDFLGRTEVRQKELPFPNIKDS